MRLHLRLYCRYMGEVGWNVEKRTRVGEDSVSECPF